MILQGSWIRRVEEWEYGDLLHDMGFGGDAISDVVWIRTANNQSYQAIPEWAKGE